MTSNAAAVASINASVQGGILTLPDGRAIDLLKIQAACNAGFQENGDKDLMEGSDQLSFVTGMVQGPSGEFVPRVDAPVDGALDPIQCLAIDVYNSESNDGCADDYTVVYRPPLIALIDAIRTTDVFKKAKALAPTQNALSDAMQHHEEVDRRVRSASMFMTELQDSVESLTGIAQEHGPRTLADLFHLHSAILNNSFIDYFVGESAVFDIASGLPSGEHWVRYIQSIGQ